MSRVGYIDRKVRNQLLHRDEMDRSADQLLEIRQILVNPPSLIVRPIIAQPNCPRRHEGQTVPTQKLAYDLRQHQTLDLRRA